MACLLRPRSHSHAGRHARTFDSADQRSLQQEFDAVRFLQIQGLVYSAVEQLSSLVYAARRHESGTDRFFKAYTKNLNLNTGVKLLAKLSRDQLACFFGVEKLDAFIESIAPSEDRTAPQTFNIGPFEYPRSEVDDELKEHIRARVEGVLDTFMVNFRQVQALVAPPDGGVPGQPAAHSLRSIDNSFRHGLRVLFHSASPQPRTFKVVGEYRGTATMSVYMPSANGEIEFGSIETSEQSMAHSLETLRWLSVRIGQFAGAFLGNHTIRTAEPVVVASLLHLGDLPEVSEAST